MIPPTISMNEKGLFQDNKSYIGLGLAVTSCAFIGTSFIINKLSLMRLASNVNTLRASSGGYGYIKDWMWWLGFLMMGTGELINFAAYMFAPASLVTPLGALSVLISAILASRFLGEELTNSGKIGCFLCIIGATVFVIHAPKEEEIQSFFEFSARLKNSLFTYYILYTSIFVLVMVAYVGPKYGTRYVWVYISLCSVIGSVTVVACKALSIVLKEVVDNEISNIWTILLLVIFIVLCIALQMNYLNRALDLFSASIVTPVYYVMFTTLVIMASASLLQEWSNMMMSNVVGTIIGFLVISFAVYLLNVNKTSNMVRNSLKSSHSQPLLRHGQKVLIGV